MPAPNFDRHSTSSSTQTVQREKVSPHHRPTWVGFSALIAILLLMGAGALLEYFNAINLLPGFGRSLSPRDELLESQREIDFADVPNGSWARPFIQGLILKGAVTGFPGGGFNPDESITRGQFAAMVESAFELDSEQAIAQFQDVPSDYWAQQEVARVVAAGFMTEYPTGEFRPTERMTRAEVLVALVNGLRLEAERPIDETLAIYEDADQIPPYARGAIAIATEAGMVVNYPNEQQLNPTQTATRADAAAMLYQAMVVADRAEPFTSTFIVER